MFKYDYWVLETFKTSMSNIFRLPWFILHLYCLSRKFELPNCCSRVPHLYSTKKMYRTKAFLLTFISVTLEHNDYHTIHVCYTIQWNNLTKTIYSLHCLAYYITMLRKLYLDFCFIILIMNIFIIIFWLFLSKYNSSKPIIQNLLSY